MLWHLSGSIGSDAGLGLGARNSVSRASIVCPAAIRSKVPKQYTEGRETRRREQEPSRFLR